LSYSAKKTPYIVLSVAYNFKSKIKKYRPSLHVTL